MDRTAPHSVPVTTHDSDTEPRHVPRWNNPPRRAEVSLCAAYSYHYERYKTKVPRKNKLIKSLRVQMSKSEGLKRSTLTLVGLHKNHTSPVFVICDFGHSDLFRISGFDIRVLDLVRSFLR